MTDKSSIIQLGNPLLQQKATEIEGINDREIQQLIDHLITTVVQANGVAIVY